MPYERLISARKKAVGSKETLKSIERGQAKVVYVAKNAERRITEPIIRACRARGTPLEEVPSMRELGKACGISVNCASAAVIED
ncbi:L7Ae/L30e/S12e/Gadd45 family ribosomal protein [Thermodesulfitimonas autotrophica]|jgi:large subunit ribosomal protein L7A|uniref:Large subunit ribosomal protein L7A n=1 Tax=Thermodesulfitimonas autotrophica TaxID=1894989 RepID=A0A3N5BFD9_9THEO|nr:ribosomal L7Ae/L30e/S12e/Gadd45 family protein [Thermodesulfitimonas autotrophica]RPF42761.1 large subunit ribosomal protein L7A [Thermodesulfitimonas autotrophica]